MNWVNHFFGMSDDLIDASDVRHEIEQAINFRGSNLLILIIAIFVASIGLNVNSTAVIIGAMLISPLMGPIMGIGLGSAIGDLYILKRAIRNYVFATVAGLFTSSIYFVMSPLDEAHSELLARTAPNFYDLLVAIFGGAAGIIAVSSKNKGNVMPGVAIATALMPPLCTAGYGIATAQPVFIFGALYLYLINSVYIALATFLFSKYHQFPRAQLANPKEKNRSTKVILFFTLVTLLPSLYLGYDLITKSKFKSNVNQFIQSEINKKEIFILGKQINPSQREVYLNYLGEKIDSLELTLLRDRLKHYGLEGTKLFFDQKFENLNKLLSSSKERNNSEVLQLFEVSAKMDSIATDYEKILSIEKELLILYPSVEAIYTQMIKKDTPSFLIKIRELSTIDSVEARIIRDWIKLRLSVDSIKLNFAK